MLTGTIFLATWALFDDAYTARYFAAFVPATVTAKFAAIGLGIISVRRFIVFFLFFRLGVFYFCSLFDSLTCVLGVQICFLDVTFDFILGSGFCKHGEPNGRQKGAASRPNLIRRCDQFGNTPVVAPDARTDQYSCSLRR